ncbi:MAG: COX15/CtaA family protein, partial [Sphingomonadales bacterium]
MIPRPFFQQSNPNLRKVGWWLMIVALMVFLIIMVGGATRLTQSGLSIVEWKPLSGTFPPFSTEAWQEEFSAYKAYPEYQQRGQDMTLEDFKGIYWWEYSHRLLGRLIGLMFALPLLYFLRKGWIPREMKMRMFFLLALGAGQGLLGWYMVQSGLVDRPSVSHYRLAAHLSLAVLVFAVLMWTAWQFLEARQFEAPQDRAFGGFTRGLLGFVSLQLIYGAFVAGLDAGLIYNEFPLMGGQVYPTEMWALNPGTA